MCKFAFMKLLHAILTVFLAPLQVVAQDVVPVSLLPDVEHGVASVGQPGFQSTTPSPVAIAPAYSLKDSIAAYGEGNTFGMLSSMSQQYDFRMNPYGNDWSRGGVMAMPGGGFLTGSSSFTAMSALGNVGAASLTWMQPLGDRLTVAVGVSANKYHFDRSAWNDYGVFASARYHINSQLALKAWGSYYMQPLYHTMAVMPYVGTSNYGASLDMRMSEHWGMELGAQRQYDPFSQRWRTLPVIAPKFYIAGSPISIDLGGIVGNLLDSRNNKDIDPMKPVDMNGTKPPGFNPHSPVRIPDALRR